MNNFLLISAFIAITLVVVGEIVGEALKNETYTRTMYAIVFCFVLMHLIIIECEIGLIK